jgi:hypothetical protein
VLRIFTQHGYIRAVNAYVVKWSRAVGGKRSKKKWKKRWKK